MQEKVTMSWLITWVNARIQEKLDVLNENTFAHWLEKTELKYDEENETGTCAICAWSNNDYEVKDLEPESEAYSKWWQLSSGYWADRGLRDYLGRTFFWTDDHDGEDEYVIRWENDEENEGSYIVPSFDDQLRVKALSFVADHWTRFSSDAHFLEVQARACIEHTFVCRVCEDGYLKPVGYVWNNSDDLCRGCADSYSLCEWGDHWTSESLYWLRGDHCCFDCARDAGYDICESCDEWYPEDYRCDNCSDSDWDSNTNIHSYSYKPDPRFGWVEEVDGDLSNRSARRGVLFMGLEIEVECKGGSIPNGVNVLEEAFGADENYLYLKSDGSLNYGFEIVTHPRTLASHKSEKLQAFKVLADSGFRGWNTQTCGIHVHVNRDGFNGVPHQWRWTRLFANNENQMTILAGRKSDQWATFSGMKSKLSQAFKFHRGRGDNRYEAINLTNWDTFEVRIFKSSLNPERIMMIMELIDATVEYTRHLTVQEISDHALEWARFIDWVVSEQSLKYPNLIAYCQKYGITTLSENPTSSVGNSDSLVKG